MQAGGIELTKVQAKFQTWGGQSYVNVQAESKDWSLTAKGAVTTFVLEVRR